MGFHPLPRDQSEDLKMKKLVLALTALATFSGSALAADLPARTYSKSPAYVAPAPSWTGFYIFGGGGVENNLDIFGINLPGLFMKTEYRAAYYGTATLPESISAPIPPINQAITFKAWDETVSTSLVYRFNWTGPVVSKY